MFCTRSRHDIVAVRAAAFLKRLLILTTKLEEDRNVMALLFILKEFMNKAPVKVQQLMMTDEEERPFSSGVYNAETDLPDMCNSFSAQLTEMEQLKNHKNKDIAKFVHTEFEVYQKPQ